MPSVYSRPRRLGLFAFAVLLCGCDPGDRPDTISIATAGTGGVYYLLGGALAESWSRELPDRIAVAEVTGGSVENLNLLSRAQVTVAFSMGTNADQALRGIGPFVGTGGIEVRALAALYPNVLHLVTLEGSEIETLQDLRGRRVSVGAPGSGTEVAARTLLEANGIGYEAFSPQRLNFNESANALRDGQADAAFWSVGPPAGSLLDLATVRSVRIISLLPGERERAGAADPTLRSHTLLAGTYPGQIEEVATLATPNVLVVRADMPEELAWELTRVLFESLPELSQVHPAAGGITPAYTLENSPIPLHPGALRYFRDLGLPIPRSLEGH